MTSVDAVTIIIPSLHSPIVDQVLAALSRQSWLPTRFEILVIGLDKYHLVQADEKVRLISTQVPVSPARARNIGWRAASNETIIFLDSDCIPREDWLVMLLCFWSEHSDAGAILAGMDFDSRNFWTVCDQVAAFHEHMAWNPPSERASLPSYSLLVTKSVLQKTGGFDESFARPAAEDLDLTIRIAQLGCRLYFCSQAVVTHRPRRQSFRALWRHGYWSGHESIGVRLRHRTRYHMPAWSGNPWAWRLLALPIAAGMTIRILSDRNMFPRFALCAPFVMLAKLAWCLGAADSVTHRRGDCDGSK